MTRNASLVLAVLLWTGITPRELHAQTMASPAAYVELELSLRQLTNDGMRQRLALLRGADLDSQADQQLDDRTRTKVTAAYRRFATTPGAHLAYGSRNRPAIESWLSAHPESKARLQKLNDEFRELSASLSAVARTR